MTNTLIHTDNLNIRPFTIADAPFVFELLNTPAWKEFIGDRNINTIDDAVNYIRNGPLLSYKINGYGPWLVTLNSTQQPIGMCGLFKRDYLDNPDIGFAFLPAFEGRGLAYESTMAILTYITTAYSVKKLYATTTVHNLRSQHLLQRCGFKPAGTVTAPDAGPLLLFELNL